MHPERHGAVSENRVSELLGAELQALGVLDGGLVDADVGEDHDREGSVEADGGREDEIADVVGEGALPRRRRTRRGRPPPSDRRKRDGRRADPHQADEDPRLGVGHLGRVGHGIRDGPVSVE